MFGVLLDVSGSMRNAYALDDDELHRDDVSVERTHAVFTTIAKIVEREVTHHDRHESSPSMNPFSRVLWDFNGQRVSAI